MQRTSLGSPDNDINGLPDASGSLNMSKIRADRAMVGDTIEATVHSVIGATSDNFAYAQYNSTVDFGSVLDALPATATIYDASSATQYVVSGITATTTASGGTQSVFGYNLNASELASLNPALSGFQFATGDSINLNFVYKVEESVTGLIQETSFYNEFYIAQTPSPSASEKKSCNFRNGRITLIGYSLRNDWQNEVNLISCSQSTRQYFGMSIGNLPSNYAGGNLFPFEYRSWGTLKDAYVEIPANYHFVSAKVVQYRTVNTNSSATQTVNDIIPTSIAGTMITFDIAHYYNSGQLEFSDDGFHGNIEIELAADCNTPKDVYEDIDWTFNYQKTDAIDGLESGIIAAGASDRIKYNPAKIKLISSDPYQNTSTRNVSWDFKVRNRNSGTAANSWIYIEAPANIVITSIVNDATSLPLTKIGDFLPNG